MGTRTTQTGDRLTLTRVKSIWTSSQFCGFPWPFHIRQTRAPVASRVIDCKECQWSGILQSPIDLQPNLPVALYPVDPEACRLMIQ